ncbi:unnamed protein product [Mesocestoides corti]|uniref:SH2 domain-containing protein n=1 Tax=Mesocestoides corti TaxID=53468 RepID=A0A0R3UQT3_MESCO|nr:unnamed protein product [Mesocestoides corti]
MSKIDSSKIQLFTSHSRAVATISHQASRDRVTRIISLSDVAPQPSWGTSTTNPASSEPNSGEFEGEILIVDTVELHSSSPPTPTATKPPLSSCPWLSPPRPVLRRQSTSNVMITSPSESLAFCSISPRAELLPIPSTAAVCGSDANGISIARSSSLRTYAVPNSNGTATITSRHFSSTAAPSVVGKVMATSSPILPSHSSMPWYFGEMDRAEATQLLTGCEDGTFLVRISKNVSRMGEYSLSVVYHHPRHIRIQRSADSSFYLCSPQRFKSLEHMALLKTSPEQIENFADVSLIANALWHRLCRCLQNRPSSHTPFDYLSLYHGTTFSHDGVSIHFALVDFYCRVSLNECFDEVQTCLRFPYQRCPEESVLFYARAQHDFGGDANPRMLSLTRGDLVHVISTRGNERGWWKGWLNGRVCFLPLWSSLVPLKMANSAVP